MRFGTTMVVLMLTIAPVCAQSGGSGSQGSVGEGGNGVTTSSSSGPEAKVGAERSSTGGAPTGDAAETGTKHGGNGGNTR